MKSASQPLKNFQFTPRGVFMWRGQYNALMALVLIGVFFFGYKTGEWGNAGLAFVAVIAFCILIEIFNFLKTAITGKPLLYDGRIDRK
jgi:hypothetical protein